jgi:hypothetical protein
MFRTISGDENDSSYDVINQATANAHSDQQEQQVTIKHNCNVYMICRM